MENNKIEVINLSNYTSPIVRDSKHSSLPYVTLDLKNNNYNNAGKYKNYRNNYFEYLFDRKNGSATNGAIIHSITCMIQGQGIDSDPFNELFTPENQRRFTNDFYTVGFAYIEVVFQGGRKSIKSAKHMPAQMLAPEKVDENGVINAYYFARDWSAVKGVGDTERIVSFESNEKNRGGKEIIALRPYKEGRIYFAEPLYQGGLQYAELEEEIANYHINNIKNGLAPSFLINFNNGVPADADQKRLIVRDVHRKYQGSSNAGKAIVSFNENKDAAATIEVVPLSDAPKQYEFLSNESSNKLITAHRVTSPLLLGLRPSSGFSSNAEELETSSKLFESLVINPLRMQILEVYNTIKDFNNINDELEFISLNPFEDVETVTTNEEVTPDNEVQAQKICCSHDGGIKLEAANELISLGDEINMDDYDLILDEERLDEHENDGYSPNSDAFLSKIIEVIKLTISTGTARPNARSEQDNEDVLVRYKYVGNKSPQRPFCKAMMSANKTYRKEDIIQMGDKVVNSGWGPNGSDKYSIWLYAGGGNCYHKWNRQIFLRKGTNVDTRSPLAQTISRSEARRRGYEIEPNNSPDEQRTAAQGVAPINQKNKGFLNPQ